MKRFIGMLGLLAIGVIMAIGALHIVVVISKQKDFDRVYMLSPDTQFLFLGASEVGCAIEERPELHNKVIWVSGTSIMQWHVRLLELERRNQLDHLKAVVVPYNYRISNSQNARAIRWAFYQELPISWRYIDEIPFSWFEEVIYMACNLRLPFHMEACSIYPEGRLSIAGRTESWRHEFLAEAVATAMNMEIGRECLPDWENITRSSYQKMNEICRRHNISFVVYRQPILDEYWRTLPQKVIEYQQQELRWMESQGIRVLSLPPSFGKEYFCDVVHLVELGRTMFTDFLFADIGSLLK